MKKFLHALNLPAALLIFGAGVLSGCGDAGPHQDKPARTPVTGVVTLDGTPLAGATIVLHPKEHQHAAIGRSNDQGQFVIETYTPKDGAVPGVYEITVVKEEFQAPSGPVNDDQPSDIAPPKSLVPVGYTNRMTSGLSTTVTEGAENKIELSLSSKHKSASPKTSSATRSTSE